MPAILQDSKQIKALNEIEEMLETIKKLNSIIYSQNIPLSISTIPNVGRGVKTVIGEQERTKIISVLLSNKKRLIKEITTTAARFRIKLTEEEEARMKYPPQTIEGPTTTDETIINVDSTD